MADREGVVSSVQIARELAPAVIDEMTWWTPGDAIDNHLVQKLGIVFLGFSTVEEMRRLVAQFSSLVSVEMESSDGSSAGTSVTRVPT